MIDNLFPLGTVVIVKGYEGYIMITGRLIEAADDSYYEYSGCPFPEGIVSENHFLFNGEDIEAVNFIGFQDELELAYRKSLSDAIAEYMEEE